MRNVGPLLVTFGMLVVIFGIGFLLYAWGSQGTFEEYLENGKEAEASITEKWEERSGRSRNYYVRVSYFDKSVLEGGTLYFADAQVVGFLWDDLEVEQEVRILYLPDNPEENVVLKQSTDPKNFAPIERYSFGGYTLLVGGIMFLAGLVFVRLNKRK